MEQELWSAYEAAFDSSDTGRRGLLVKAQSAWLDYRAANCELMSERPEGPANEPYAQCLSFMTRERTLELRLICRTAADAADCDLTF